jgi:hypothetical protein
MGTAREITRRVIAISSMDVYRAWGGRFRRGCLLLQGILLD